jgi:hypothetical protein
VITSSKEFESDLKDVWHVWCIGVCGMVLLWIVGRGESTLIFGNFEVRITPRESVALLKSFVESTTVSFLCPPPSYQFTSWSKEHCEHVIAIEC